ncbi:aspartate--tRNA ligase, mitochondrial [Papilio machaon]|uniref:aspartate--tRNA ligase, mitochondrial n=1 Tax=Papilio machaon TaxID=76193 RepID=UPI001E663231|nr:aspartate--tRNA ligase, mitochondrial [Papilio machaon]
MVDQGQGTSVLTSKLLELMRVTGYPIEQRNGQRKFGPPPDCKGFVPPKGCEVFIGKLPREIYEDELVPIFSKIGKIYEMRLMMDFSGSNRGYAFVNYMRKEDADEAVRKLNGFEIRPLRKIGVVKSVDNCRLFIGGIPKTKSRAEVFEELTKRVPGIVDVILYKNCFDKRLNRGFAFAEFETHRAAAMARRSLIPGCVKLWDHDVMVDWAEPEPSIEEDLMKTVKVLYARNFQIRTTPETIQSVFEAAIDNKIERVKKIYDYAFIHFYQRSHAELAMNKLQNTEIDGSNIEIKWAKPVDRDLYRIQKQTKGNAKFNNSLGLSQTLMLYKQHVEKRAYEDTHKEDEGIGSACAGESCCSPMGGCQYVAPQESTYTLAPAKLDALCKRYMWMPPVYTYQKYLDAAGAEVWVSSVELPEVGQPLSSVPRKIGPLVTRPCYSFQQAYVQAAELALQTIKILHADIAQQSAPPAIQPTYTSVLSPIPNCMGYRYEYANPIYHRQPMSVALPPYKMLRRKLMNSIDLFYGIRNIQRLSSGRFLTYKLKHTLVANKREIDTEKEIKKSQDINAFTYRTHTCGELRSMHNGKSVTLCGWVQYQRMSKFLLLRDSYGVTQCIVNNNQINFNDVPLESIVKINGTVSLRPTNMINSKMSTGEIEVVIDQLEVLNVADKVPFNLRVHQKPKEQLRMQHRYLDIRFPDMQNKLRTRSSMLHNMRKFLIETYGFVEVETPTLFCRTPGGAREFVVPTHYPGLFYSLVQSPQQFKQMLMAGGVDRYFQVARCYRDETTRPDRQPEFTQLDIEISFTNLDHIIKMIDQLLYETFTKPLPNPPFKRITYTEAIENYGTDKPDISYDLRFKNVSHLFNNNDEAILSAFVLPYPAELGKLSSKHKDKIKEIKQKNNVRVILNENVSKELSNDMKCHIQSIVGENKAFILALGSKEKVCTCLGEIRQQIAVLLQSKELIEINKDIEPLWIVDFPLFTEGDNGLETCHHPFTAPHPEDFHMLDSEPLKVRALAYDIVMNGNEIGGGSVRVHNADLQEKLLRMLNIDASKLMHFINALRSGCPPHAGIALGIDRLITIACDADSIRDVIAFPKSHEGKDPLSGAPNVITEDDKKYYHINVVK